MRDLNMRFAQRLGLKYSKQQQLPAQLRLKGNRAKLVHEMDGPFIQDTDLHKAPGEVVDERITIVSKIAANYMPLFTFKERVGIALRLWAGCLSAAKIIAYETRAGRNTPEYRRMAFRRLLLVCRNDRIFLAGVQAAISFKRLRHQGYSFKGGEKRVLKEMFGRKL